jgi:hypothetical protein
MLLLCDNYLLYLSVIAAVALVINASGMVSGTTHAPTSSRDQNTSRIFSF